MNELKPCPFCGEDAAQRDFTEPFVNGWIGCQKCHCFINWVKSGKPEAIAAWNQRTEPENPQLTLDELRQMDGEPVWIEVLDKPELSRWHFVVRTQTMGLIAKDGLGQYECYPHNEKQMVFNGCYFDIEHGHNYGINWLAYRHKIVTEKSTFERSANHGKI